MIAGLYHVYLALGRFNGVLWPILLRAIMAIFGICVLASVGVITFLLGETCARIIFL
jgi:hypothetical protein